jgi:hypothetical protein
MRIVAERPVNKPKPCPLCGCAVEVDTVDTISAGPLHQIACECGLSFVGACELSEFIKLWNRRV